VTWTIVLALTAVALLMPPTLGPPADAFVVRPDTPVDLVAAWWLPLSETMRPGSVWLLALAGTMAVLFVPRWTRRDRTDVFAPSTVDPRLCTGCNQCPQDCPWEAITMVPREDERPTLLAQVDPAKCVSCGICAGSCAPMGVGPPGRSGRDQLALVRAELAPALDGAPRPSIVAVCCAQAPRAHVAALRERGAIMHAVPCAGNLHSSVIEVLLRGGAAGVLVCACAPRDCASREGPKWLNERLYHDREAELQPRVDRRRVRVVTFAAGERARSIAAFQEFRDELAALAQPARDDDALELVCDPVPAEEGSS
jgi:ferredoxin